MQAHPEFASRPLNPSPPFLGFIAASCGILDEQLESQKNFRPPHPKSLMILESEARERKDYNEKPAGTPPGSGTPVGDRSRSPERGEKEVK